MELKGNVIKILDEQSGQGSNGTWRKQEFVLEIPGNYPKNVCISMWGSNIDTFDIKTGEEITVQVDIESREYNGKWYTNVKAWKISRESSNTEDRPEDAAWPDPSEEIKTDTAAEDFDDLPF